MVGITYVLSSPESLQRFKDIVDVLLDTNDTVTEKLIDKLKSKARDLQVSEIDYHQILLRQFHQRGGMGFVCLQSDAEELFIVCQVCKAKLTEVHFRCINCNSSVIDTVSQRAEVAIPSSGVVGTTAFDQLSEGLNIEQVIEAFFDGCNKGPDRLFITKSWMSSRLPVMRQKLLCPVTLEEADLLRDVVLKKVGFDLFLEWLKLEPRLPWSEFQDLLARRRADDESEQAARAATDLRQAEDDERKFAEIAAAPLQRVSGNDVLSACYDAWVVCEFPPGLHLPGGGMGEMVLEGLRSRFATYFCAGLRAELPQDQEVRSLQVNPDSLGLRFDQIWQRLPRDHRRELVVRLWRKHLWAKTSIEWDKKPDDAIGLLNLREFMLVRSLAPNLKQRYRWLGTKQDTTIRKAAGVGSVSLSFTFSVIWPDLNGLLVQQRGDSVPRDHTLCLSYRIGNAQSFGFDVWLGADLSQDDSCFYNIDEDLDVTIKPGANYCERLLTVHGDWPSGQMILSVGIWYGPISDTSRSVRLALAQERISVE